MTTPIKNRYEFVLLYDVENGNPNGDPDAGNMPRIDPETGYGIVTDVCLKRKIRNYAELVKGDSTGYRIYVKEGIPLNQNHAEAYVAIGAKSKDKVSAAQVNEARQWMCANFFDVRTFGAVMSTGDNKRNARWDASILSPMAYIALKGIYPQNWQMMRPRVQAFPKKTLNSSGTR